MAFPARMEKWRASWEGYSRPKAAMNAKKADITILKTVPRLKRWVAREYSTCTPMPNKHPTAVPFHSSGASLTSTLLDRLAGGGCTRKMRLQGQTAYTVKKGITFVPPPTAVMTKEFPKLHIIGISADYSGSIPYFSGRRRQMDGCIEGQA